MDPRIFIFVIAYVLTTAAAPQAANRIQAPQTKDSEVKILKQINKVNNDGSYTYGYEASDGSFKVETRDVDGIVKGKYGFVDGNGQLKTVEYTAGEKASTSSSADSDNDQNFAAQTPSAKTVKTVVTSKVKEQQADEESYNDDDDGKYNGNGRDDFGSFGAQQQGSPQVFQQRQGQFQGSPFQGDGGSDGSPFLGQDGSGQFDGPQYVPTGQQQFIGSPQQFQGQGAPLRFQGQQPQFQLQGQPQGFSGQGQRQLLGGFQPSRGQSFDGLSGNQFGGPTSGGFPILSGQGGPTGQFRGAQALNGQGPTGGDGEFVGNVDLDGFSEDQDQDGFVDAFPGAQQQQQGAARSAQVGSSDKAPAVALGAARPNAATRTTTPQQVVRIQNNPSLQSQGVSPVFFNGPQSNGQIFGPGQPGQPGSQLTDAQIQAFNQFQGQPGFQGVNQGGPQSLQGGQFNPAQFQSGPQQFSQFNPAQFQNGPQQFSQFNPNQFQNGPQQFSQFNPAQFQGGPQQFSSQPGGGFQAQPQQFSTGAGQQFSPGIPQSQGQQQGGLVQIQGGQFSPSTPGSSGTFSGGPSQFSSQGGISQGVPFGAIQGGNGQQFSPVQNFLPQGGQGGGIPPQFLQQGGPQTFNAQQGGSGGIQSAGFPFDYNPYSGISPYQGLQGQFGAGGAAGIQPGQGFPVQGVSGPQGISGPQAISGQGTTYLLGGQQQQRGAPVSFPAVGSGGAASESVSKQESQSKQTDEKKAT